MFLFFGVIVVSAKSCSFACAKNQQSSHGCVTFEMGDLKETKAKKCTTCIDGTGSKYVNPYCRCDREWGPEASCHSPYLQNTGGWLSLEGCDTGFERCCPCHRASYWSCGSINQYGKNPFVHSYCPPYYLTGLTTEEGWGGCGNCCGEKYGHKHCNPNDYGYCNLFGHFYGVGYRRPSFNPRKII